MYHANSFIACFKYFKDFRGSPGTKAEHVHELLREYAIAADRCVVIGDALADLAGAVANDVKFLGRVAENDENRFPDEVTTFVDFHHLPESWRQES